MREKNKMDDLTKERVDIFLKELTRLCQWYGLEIDGMTGWGSIRLYENGKTIAKRVGFSPRMQEYVVIEE